MDKTHGQSVIPSTAERREIEVPMLEAMLVIVGCQLAGEAFARLLALPVPGPVAGMLILFAGLWWHEHRAKGVKGSLAMSIGVVAAFLLAHLSLLFVPAGTGIIGHLPTLATHGIGLVIALVVSTFLSLLVTCLVFVSAARWSGNNRPLDEDTA
jgi:holin-like protein